MTPSEATAILMRANAAITCADLGDQEGVARNWDALLGDVRNATD